MRKYMLLPVTAAVLCAVTAQQNINDAVCVFQAGSVSGYVRFHQELGTDVAVEGNITGLSQGKHGFHVHQNGDLTDGCTSAGGHYNPFNKNHGAPDAKERHVGDLGNIEADECGSAVFTLTDPLLQLNGEYSIIGRSVVVHADEDDLGLGGHDDSLTTGHAGARIGCCVIGIAAAPQK
ncbi:superoxide dismutase [Cu-Zn]-like [Haemaphysalis longicornis]